MTKYIILGNGTGWCKSCWEAAIDGERVRFIPEMIPFDPTEPLYKICFTHYRFRSPWVKVFPLTSIWYDKFTQTLAIDNTCNTVLIIYDWNFISKDFKFLKYLRNRYPKLKIVYLFSNIVEVTGAKTYHILKDLNTNYDIVFAFDKKDAKKYNFSYNPLIYTTLNKMPPYSKALEYDLFYIGKAKDRYYQLVELFHQAKSEGLWCNFNIVGVPKEEQVSEDGINYSPLKYSTVLKMMAKSKCFVDVIQGGSTGLTIKTCEAVVLGRKLITTNKDVVNEPFYHQENILLYEHGGAIRPFINADFLPYTNKEKAYFSPESLFNNIDYVLSQK